MTAWNGGYPVLQDRQGSVVPIFLSSPAAIPADGLTFDVSGLQQAITSQPFGNIKGITIDASNCNAGQASLTVSFPALGITRQINTGSVSVIQVPGAAQQVTLNNVGWTSGSIQLTLWNTIPNQEVTSPVGVTISGGSIAISGTPTVQFAPNQNVGITGTPNVNIASGNVGITGNVTVGNINSGTVTFTNSQISVAHEALNIQFLTVPISAGRVDALVSSGVNGTIRSLSIVGSNIKAFRQTGSISVTLRNHSNTQSYWSGVLPAPADVAVSFTLIELSLLGIPFTGGIDIAQAANLQTPIFSADSQLNINVGYQ